MHKPSGHGNSIHDWMTARIAAFGFVREGLSCGSWAEFAASDEGECGIPDVGEVLRGASGSHPAGVLGEDAVPDEEEAVASRPEGLHLRPLSER
jgi:hypothetical protein